MWSFAGFLGANGRSMCCWVGTCVLGVWFSPWYVGWAFSAIGVLLGIGNPLLGIGHTLRVCGPLRVGWRLMMCIFCIVG